MTARAAASASEPPPPPGRAGSPALPTRRGPSPRSPCDRLRAGGAPGTPGPALAGQAPASSSSGGLSSSVRTATSSDSAVNGLDRKASCGSSTRSWTVAVSEYPET